MKQPRKKIILIVLIIVVAISIIAIAAVLLSKATKKNNDKSYDLEQIKEDFLVEYDNLNLEEMDKFDINYYFGIDVEAISDYLFLGDNYYLSQEKELQQPKNLIGIIKTNQEQDYYYILESYIESSKNNTSEKELLDLYDKAIIKKSKNYVYIILSDDPKQIEDKLLKYYK